MARSVLVLDNRDSFVWNLAQALGGLGCEVTVLRSDAVDVGAIRRCKPDALVLSPGPGRPESAGVCITAVRTLSAEMPILGVCLGHQAIAAAFGARVVRCAPCHGKPWAIEHRGAGLFRGMPNPLVACRYHSLSVDAKSLPAELAEDAQTPDGIVMALRHVDRPTFGVQFHPESFRTEHGTALLRNFVECA